MMNLLRYVRDKLFGYTPTYTNELHVTAGNTDALATINSSAFRSSALKAATEAIAVFESEMEQDPTYEEMDILLAHTLEAAAYKHLPGWTKDAIALSPDLKKVGDMLYDEVDRVLYPVEAPDEQKVILTSIADIFLDIPKEEE